MDIVWTEGAYTDAALDAWRESMNNSGFPVANSSSMHSMDFDSIHTESTARAMLRNYCSKYSNFLRQIELIAIEQPFAVPLSPDPEDNIYYVGSIDKVYKEQKNSKEVIKFADHKTTKAYKKDGPFRESFLESFSPNAQMEGYLYTGALNYQDLFRGLTVDAALVHKSEHNGFRMIPLEKSFELLDQWLIETQDYVSEFLSEYDSLFRYWEKWASNKTLPLFKRRTEECNHYAGCPYKPICRFNPNPLRMDIDNPPEGFVYDKWSPFNEIDLERINAEPGEDD